MKGILDKGHVYLEAESVIDNEYVMAVGISKIQNYVPISFYLNFDKLRNTSIKFVRSPTNPERCHIYYNRVEPIWTGVPYEVKIVALQGKQYIDVSPWIYNYSPIILLSAYVFIDHEGDLAQITRTSTHFDSLKQLARGVQLNGYIRSGGIKDASEYAVEYVLNFYELDPVPMIGRVADSRVGYFYDSMHLDVRNHISGDPVAIINRINLDKSSWRFVIDTSIPHKYHAAVKKGVMSWNNYFKALGLGEPFTAVAYNDPGYPTEVDIFDTSAWYILGTEINQFNGPYSGYSIAVCDYRSGENLFGLISLNLIKIASNPSRFMVMNGLDNAARRVDGQLTSDLEVYIEAYVAWVTAHEVGHQLGLRHNFMGNLQADGWGSVMDYVDVFNDFSDLRLLNIQDTRRDYDLKAIEYGYRPLDDEVSGVKHPELDVIASRKTAPFGTDENYSEDVNPLVGMIEDDPDPLNFVARAIDYYATYRSKLIAAIKGEQLSSYEYNTMFIYLYTARYPELIKICMRFIGGRLYSEQRNQYIEVGGEQVLQALALLLQLLVAIEYTEDEYGYFIYDYHKDNNRQEFNRLEFQTIYSMNVRNLFGFYQNMVNQIYREITDPRRLIRVLQNSLISEPSSGPDSMMEISAMDLFVNATFAFNGNKERYQITDVDALFPEVGAYLVGDDRWQTLLLEINPFKYNRQYRWIRHLIEVYNEIKLADVKEAINYVLNSLKHAVNLAILPYVESISDNYEKPYFWKQPKNKLLTHWRFILKCLKQF